MLRRPGSRLASDRERTSGRSHYGTACQCFIFPYCHCRRCATTSCSTLACLGSLACWRWTPFARCCDDLCRSGLLLEALFLCLFCSSEPWLALLPYSVESYLPFCGSFQAAGLSFTGPLRAARPSQMYPRPHRRGGTTSLLRSVCTGLLRSSQVFSGFFRPFNLLKQ